MEIKPYLPSCYEKLPEIFCLTSDQFSTIKDLDFIRSLYRAKPNIYVAQAITTNPVKPIWLGIFEQQNVGYNIINPLNCRYPSTFSPELKVKSDVLICAMSKQIILDLTKGPSVGATVEITMSKIMGKPILGVKEKYQTVSFFTDYLCSKIVNTNACFNESITLI
jgi:hypothetical protein